MGLDDLLISTGVDQLIRLVRERGRVEMGVAAKELGIPVRTAEDWAHVLEEEGLIAIEYKLTKIYLAWKAPTAEYVAKKSEKLQAKATQTREEIDRLLARVEEGGKELSEMQAEISQAESAASMGPQEVEALKSELSSLFKKQSAAAKTAEERLEKLRRKVAAFGAKSGLSSEEKKGQPDMKRELELLQKFEDTLQAQMQDAEEIFAAATARGEQMRHRLEQGSGNGEIAEAKEKLAEIEARRNELAGAIDALLEEQKGLDGSVKGLSERLAELEEESGGTAEAAKKRLAELSKMDEDAKRQKAAVLGQLQEALLAVKKQEEKFASLSEKQGKAKGSLEQMKNEYVDIADELGRAGEDLSAKQKEISQRVAAQLAALEIAKGGSQKVSREELDKVSFLLRELKREQALLDESVKVLLKEFDIMKLETVPVQSPSSGAKAGAASAMVQEQPSEAPAAFVEKVKLSQEEEGEFERKREELRSLIRKMWEEGKGGSHS